MTPPNTQVPQRPAQVNYTTLSTCSLHMSECYHSLLYFLFVLPVNSCHTHAQGQELVLIRRIYS